MQAAGAGSGAHARFILANKIGQRWDIYWRKTVKQTLSLSLSLSPAVLILSPRSGEIRESVVTHLEETRQLDRRRMSVRVIVVPPSRPMVR